MGALIETIRKALQPSAKDHPLPTGGQPWAWRYGMTGERNYGRDVGDGSMSNLVVPAIDFIANGFIEAPLCIHDNEGEDVGRHSMTDLLRRPNPHYSGALLWMPTIASWIADGNGYWIITARTGAGEPAHVYWAPHWALEPKGPADGSEFLTHYEYTVNGMKIELPIEDVIHFRWGLDPHNPRKGWSRLKTVLREIYSDEEAARFTAALLRNLGVPGLVLSPKGELQITPEEAKENKAELIQKTTGDARGEPLVFTTATDVEMYGFSPEQLDLANLRAIPESRVSAATGIPAAVLGYLAGMNQTKVGATMAELRELAYEQGVIPKMRLFAEDIRTQMLGQYTDDVDAFTVQFDQSQVRVLQPDANKLAERHDILWRAGIEKRSDAKIAMGLEVGPEDDVYCVPFNVQLLRPGEMPGELTGPAQPLALPPGQRGRLTVLQKRATPQQMSYLKRTEREGAIMQARFIDELQPAFGSLGDMAVAAWEQLKSRKVADPIDEALVFAIVSAMGLDTWRAGALGPLWAKHYQRVAELTLGALREHLALDVGVGIPDPIARQVVAHGGRNLGLVDLDLSTKRALFEALSRAREEQLGPIEAAKRIRQYVGAGRYTAMEQARAGSGVKYRAELIARTETLNAQRVSVAEAGRSAGFEHYLAFDNRTGFGDEECVARDGKLYTYDEMLAETDSEHPNGTLSWAPAPRTGVRSFGDGERKEITHVLYDDDGRMVRTEKEVV